MTSSFALKAGRGLFEKNLQQYTPADPLYEEYTDAKGRQKRRKRELPPGLSKRDAKILKSVKSRAHYLDKGFKLCGMQFGWTFVIGIIPGAGDVADVLLNYILVVRKARQAELPQWLVQRMLLNNAISAGVGLVPLVGDIVLAVFKANSRNAALLEEFLRIRGEEFLKAETQRTENPHDVKPGAGQTAEEDIPGKKKGSSGSSWFKKSNSKGKGKEVVPVNNAGTSAVAAGVRDSRFIEDVS